MSNPVDVINIPPLLRNRVDRHWCEFEAASRDRQLTEVVHSSLFSVWAASPFVASSCVREPEMLFELAESGDLLCRYAAKDMVRCLSMDMERVADEPGLLSSLRRRRQREMVRIAWRDLAGWSELDETLDDLSNLADACVAAALHWQSRRLGARYGQPRDSAGNPLQLVVLGMGKLGGNELNFSSDIDLIFAYAEDAESSGQCQLSHEEYFTQLARSLTRSLSERTADGFVFRVDTRLRPFGTSGSLVGSFAALEQYYQTHGREWERYALIKARPVAGDIEAGAQLLQTLKPFIYRRYLDFSSFQSLRDMKQLIEEQEARDGSVDNIKLGRGGIREIEFIAQVYQLIRGGRDRELQNRGLRQVLRLLGGKNHLPDFAVQELDQAYVFLRRVENRLQEYADEQVHELPTAAEGRAALMLAMGHSDWPAFMRELDHHRGKVHQHFERVFSAPQAADAVPGDSVSVVGLFQPDMPEARALVLLAEHGINDPQVAAEFLLHLRQSPLTRGLSEQGSQWLARLLPLLLGAVRERPEPGGVLLRAWQVIEAIGRRITYLALLVENPTALSQLVALCAASPWITRELARHPVLLDELLDPRALYRPPRRAALEQELTQLAESIPLDDIEAQMNLLRRFRQANTLRVAAADVGGSVPLMVVSDHLTEIAEVVLQHALRVAWQQMAVRHGRPVRPGGDAGFAVIGYGKLGGIELGYGSDIDLVFVHDGEEGQMTDGRLPIDHGSFFTRLGQKVIHLLTTRTPAGIAYEVDMQLRPSGQSGLLVTSLDAFSLYQLERAWTWEHQALVRARAVAGDETLRERFETLRREILIRPRDAAMLQQDIRSMRQRMRDTLGVRESGRFDLKHGTGGITDIEFIVQYCVLRWAAGQPELVRWPDNIRQLEVLSATGMLGTGDGGFLADTYRTYRKRLHQLKLQEIEGVVDDGEFVEQREGVARIWGSLLGNPAEEGAIPRV